MLYHPKTHRLASFLVRKHTESTVQFDRVDAELSNLEKEIGQLPFGHRLAEWKREEEDYLSKVTYSTKGDQLVNPYEPRSQPCEHPVCCFV